MTMQIIIDILDKESVREAFMRHLSRLEGTGSDGKPEELHDFVALAEAKISGMTTLPPEPSMQEVLAITTRVVNTPELGLPAIQSTLAGYGVSKISLLPAADKAKFVASLRSMLGA